MIEGTAASNSMAVPKGRRKATDEPVGTMPVEVARIAQAARLLSYDYSEKWTDARLAATLAHVDIAFLSAPGRDDAACAALLARMAGNEDDLYVMMEPPENSEVVTMCIPS